MRWQSQPSANPQNSSSSHLTRHPIHPRPHLPNNEDQPQNDGDEADPSENIRILSPDHKELRHDKRSGDMTDPFKKAVARGDRICTDPACQLHVSDVSDHRRIDETVRNAD